MMFPAQTLANLPECPMYFRRLIDTSTVQGDPYYLIFRADPLRGDASRQKAKEFFAELLYEKCGQKSSYDIESGAKAEWGDPLFGTMTADEAIDYELLPHEDNP